MYLTAHRVWSRADERSGINVFLYRHRGEPIPGMSWRAPDLARIEAQPGTLVADSVELLPGGNEVLSYLDVAAADEADTEAVIAAMRHVEESLPGGSLPVSLRVGPVVVRFGAQGGLSGAEVEEYRQLQERAARLLRSPSRQTADMTPLEAEVSFDEKGFRCWLTPASLERVRQLHGGRWKPIAISVAHDVGAAFEALHGELKRELIPLLTGLQLEQVLALGGFRFVGVEPDGTRRVVRQWPKPPALPGHPP